MKSNRLKDLIRNQSHSVSFEEYRLRYATERFLVRIQKSNFRDKIILKGGFLLGTIYQIEQRTTKDLDTLISSISSDRNTIFDMLTGIISIEFNDGVSFELIDLQDSQLNRVYDGYRAKLKMNFIDEKTFVQFDLDLGVGDKVTPSPRLIEIPLLFNESKHETEVVMLYSYPLETILAEKTEIILTLGTSNSRMKDFYDIYLILSDSNRPTVKESYIAFHNTWSFRHNDEAINEELFEDWFFTIDELISDTSIKNQSWKNYIKDREYAKELKIEDILQEFKLFIVEFFEIFQQESK